MKKSRFVLLLSLLALSSAAQDSLQPVEPGMETSGTNTELLYVALAGLALLLLVYFMWRRRRR